MSEHDDHRLAKYFERHRRTTGPIQQHVVAFHRAIGQPIVDKPSVPSLDRVKLRLRLITEEYFETMEAAMGMPLEDIKRHVSRLIEELRYDDGGVKFDLVEFADGLADLDYVIEGSRLEFGIDGVAVANEVQRSNMSKMGPDGKAVKREDGKIVKGPHFSPPCILAVLDDQTEGPGLLAVLKHAEEDAVPYCDVCGQSPPRTTVEVCRDCYENARYSEVTT